MLRRVLFHLAIGIVAMNIACAAFAQQAPASAAPAAGAPAAQAPANRPGPPVRPPLFFDEAWKQRTTPADDHGAWWASTGDVSNPNLKLTFYGMDTKELMLSGSLTSDTNPLNLWNGTSNAPIAVTLRDKDNYVDLTGLAKIRWVTRTSGFHVVRPVVKLADGTYLVGDVPSGTHADFDTSEVSIRDVRWLKLDMDRVVTVGDWIDHPDLSKVDEIGYADLMPGSGHGFGGYVNVSRFQVYGKPVKR